MIERLKLEGKYLGYDEHFKVEVYNIGESYFIVSEKTFKQIL